MTINYWGVIGAAIANMTVGMLWYGPIFGKTWRKLMGFSEADMRNMPLTAGQAICGGIVTALIMSFVLANDAFAWSALMGESGTLTFAIMLAFFPWLGFIATTQAGSWLWEGKSFKLFAFNAAESLVAMFAMALVLTFI